MIFSRAHFLLDSEYYVTDPEFEKVPVTELLSKVNLFIAKHQTLSDTITLKQYLASRAKLFDPEKTNPRVIHVCALTTIFKGLPLILL